MIILRFSVPDQGLYAIHNFPHNDQSQEASVPDQGLYAIHNGAW